jgi:hypothetical protein
VIQSSRRRGGIMKLTSHKSANRLTIGIERELTTILSAALVAIALLVAACSSGPSMLAEWQNPAYSSGAFKKIMVAGPTGNDARQRTVEDELANQLREQGIDAVPSYQVIPNDQDVDDNTVKEAAQKAGADGVLSVRTVNRDERAEPPTVMPYTWLGYFGGNFGVSMGGPTVGSYGRRYYEYTSETQLYDVRKNELVWTGTTKTSEYPEDTRAGIRSFAEAVVKELDKKNLVRNRQ